MLREKVVKSFNFFSRALVSKPPTPTNTSYPFQQYWQFKQHLCAWPPPGPHCPPILSSSTHWKAESALRGGCLPLLLLLLLLLFTSPQPDHHSLPHFWPSLTFITSLSNKLAPLQYQPFSHPQLWAEKSTGHISLCPINYKGSTCTSWNTVSHKCVGTWKARQPSWIGFLT